MDETIANRKALARKIVDRIASDPIFRREIVDSPQEALANAGFSQEIEELTDDVSGYSFGLPDLLSGFGLLLTANPTGGSPARTTQTVYSVADQTEPDRINPNRINRNTVSSEQSGGGKRGSGSGSGSPMI